MKRPATPTRGLDDLAALHAARDVGVKEAAEIVLAMIEAPGVKVRVRKTLETAYDNIRQIPQLPENQRIPLP